MVFHSKRGGMRGISFVMAFIALIGGAIPLLSILGVLPALPAVPNIALHGLLVVVGIVLLIDSFQVM